MRSTVQKRIAQLRHGQVPKGYMKTIFGVVPDAWHKSKIDEICRLSSGSTPRRDNAGNFNGNILWVTSGELKAKFVYDTKEKVSQLATKESRLELYEPGTVVVAIYGLEATGIRGTASIIEKRCTISQACMAFSGFKGVDNEFFYYWYLHNGPLIGIRFAQGTKQQNLSSEIIGSLPICFPPLAEQRKIAKILAAQDRVIELKAKLLEETKRRKKALMKMLMEPMGTKRLEGASPRDPIKRLEAASPRGEAASCRLNNEWHIAHVSDLFVPIARKNTTGNKNILTISAQDGLVNQFEYYKHQYASVDVSGYTLLKRGEFAYNKSRSGEYPYGAIKKLDKYEVGVVSPLYLCFTAKDDACLDFWTYYFEAGMLNRSLYRIAQEGARNHGLLNIPTDGFLESELLVPPLPIQRHIAAILSAADMEIDLIRQDLEQEVRKKKALMQLLLTGIVRVKEAAGSRFSTREGQ